MSILTPDFVRATVLDVLTNIAPQLDAGELNVKRPLREQLDVDSSDLLNVLIAVKERIGVEVSEKDHGRMQTVDDIVACLCRGAAVAG